MVDVDKEFWAKITKFYISTMAKGVLKHRKNSLQLKFLESDRIEIWPA